MLKKLCLGLGVFWFAGVLGQSPQRLPALPTLGLFLMEKRNGIPGVMVAEVGERTPAATAGFSPGDFVVRIGEHAITRMTDVLAALDQVAPGASVEIVVLRGDQEQTLPVTPGPPRE